MAGKGQFWSFSLLLIQPYFGNQYGQYRFWLEWHQIFRSHIKRFLIRYYLWLWSKRNIEQKIFEPFSILPSMPKPGTGNPKSYCDRGTNNMYRQHWPPYSETFPDFSRTFPPTFPPVSLKQKKGRGKFLGNLGHHLGHLYNLRADAVQNIWSAPWCAHPTWFRFYSLTLWALPPQVRLRFAPLRLAF